MQAIQIYGKDIYRGKGFSVCDNVFNSDHEYCRRDKTYFSSNLNNDHDVRLSQDFSAQNNHQPPPTAISKSTQGALTGSTSLPNIQHESHIHVFQIEDMWESSAIQKILLEQSIVR